MSIGSGAGLVAGILARAAIAIAAALIAIGGVVAASGFLIAALYLYLRALPMAPDLAALVVAVALLALAGLVVVAARIVISRRVRPAVHRAVDVAHRGPVDTIAADLGSRAASEAPAVAAEHPYGVVSLAFLGGLALGGSPGLQQIVVAALKAANGDSGQPAGSATAARQS